MLKAFQRAELEFDIIKEIGHDGQNSRTYIAHDHQLNAEIVIKQILKTKLASAPEFFAESKALYASAHPNVVQIHYACFDNDNVYIAMPHYQKGSVKALMATRFLTVREIVVLATQTLSGLHNIHSKNLVHFDVKPDNILLSPRGEALVSDFGQAKQMNFSGIAAQDRLYSKMVPPEATKTDHFDKSFDIYQVGLTLYRMANGNEHFNQQFDKYGPSDHFDRTQFQYDLRNGKFPDRSSFLPHIPNALRMVIRKCLQVDPTDRFGSAIEVANAMANIDGECLDWCYAPQAGTKVWTKNKNGTRYILTVNPDGSSVCTKSVNGGPDRKVGAVSKANITDPELKKVFGTY
jgi:serine/threonine protein kinase